MRGLIVDNFAGGGGASTGIAWAIGRSVDIAINHDPDAIAMHSANHPETLHYCESVFDIDPVQATAGKPVDLAWFSPDCKHFSKAKGSKPVSKEIRGLAWVTVRWAMMVRPRVLMLENVEEFKTWGPVIECPVTEAMRPCPERKGETFNAFVSMLSTGIDAEHPALAECVETLGLLDTAKLMKGLGYKVEWRELRACDFGAPTIRKRLFMIARCDGQPIVWPEPTHGAPNSEAVKSGKLQPWRTAAECIDWSLPCRSIFGRKKPLAENTMKRIAKGIQKFVFDAKEPFIVPQNVTLAPFITEHANASNQRNMPVDEPLRTICAEVKGGHFAVVQPVLAAANICKHYGGNYSGYR
ncbi:DNA cytosine methyltransferase [Shewanella sp. PP-Sp27a-2]